ncbi:aldo/keto reductase [Halococcoides cellulosivorans]|uniref:Aldehyde oxidoreductase n=1 Tax=Halococcoides cellulosivorans TaxID=1679096 RepID=A0A2R4X4F6_9EURY|nr:aldo/keto reductase [Halococcoides cellulosivorans]AWB28684.1 aldehyde oxidoreductase [Halococcoides cellulosivorans]
MPTLGLGTWENADPDQCATSVATALEAGYRHVDTAQIYENEAAVGEGIARADVDREEIFLATKIWTRNLAPENVIETAEASLDRLGVDAVDLLYVHWPAHAYEPTATLDAFEDLLDRGLIDRIGVSNFTPEHVREAQAAIDAPIFANQVEMHPYLPQRDLREFAAETDLEIVAYSPLARGAVLDDPTITEIASAHDASPAQVAIAWAREKGVTPIPKATSEAHIRDNLGALDLDLTPGDVAAIDGIDRRDRRVDPDFGPDAWE